MVNVPTCIQVMAGATPQIRFKYAQIDGQSIFGFTQIAKQGKSRQVKERLDGMCCNFCAKTINASYFGKGVNFVATLDGSILQDTELEDIYRYCSFMQLFIVVKCLLTIQQQPVILL